MRKSGTFIQLKAPVATDDPTLLADFLEASALKNADRNASLMDLMRVLRRSGSVDALDDGDGVDGRSEQTEACADAASSELDDRGTACGKLPSERYPFDLDSTGRVLTSSFQAAETIYGFMLLLTAFGLKAGGARVHPERLFEEICRHAAAAFLGGEKMGAEAVGFGSPRSNLPVGFSDALAELCKRVGEMEPKRLRSTHRAKDGQLDIVAWRHFPDRRAGKLIVFGQCAAGQNNWRVKAKELQLDSFTKRWLSAVPSVDPLRMFFVPWRVPRDEHSNICVDGGIVLDRCRIALLCNDVDKKLVGQCSSWSRKVLGKWKR